MLPSQSTASGRGCADAVYHPQPITEYEGNPFIEALPPVLGPDTTIDAMTSLVQATSSERAWDNHIRLLLLDRIADRFRLPLETHIRFSERFSRLIRWG